MSPSVVIDEYEMVQNPGGWPHIVETKHDYSSSFQIDMLFRNFEKQIILNVKNIITLN